MGYDAIMNIRQKIESEFAEEQQPLVIKHHTGQEPATTEHLLSKAHEEIHLLNVEINDLVKELHEVSKYKIAFHLLVKELQHHEGNQETNH